MSKVFWSAPRLPPKLDLEVLGSGPEVQDAEAGKIQRVHRALQLVPRCVLTAVAQFGGQVLGVERAQDGRTDPTQGFLEIWPRPD
jgi:hypothetical protein